MKMSDRRVEEYRIEHASNRRELVKIVSAFIQMGINDPSNGRWEPQGGPFMVTDGILKTTTLHQAMVRTKKVLL